MDVVILGNTPIIVNFKIIDDSLSTCQNRLFLFYRREENSYLLVEMKLVEDIDISKRSHALYSISFQSDMDR